MLYYNVHPTVKFNLKILYRFGRNGRNSTNDNDTMNVNERYVYVVVVLTTKAGGLSPPRRFRHRDPTP